MADLVWMRQHFPWLSQFYVAAVAERHAANFRGSLEELGFVVIEIDGRRQVDAASFWAEMKRSFALPDYFSSGWDAMDDCWWDERLGTTRLAVLWRSADVVASRLLALYSAGIAWMRGTADGLGASGVQMEVIISGAAADFSQPIVE